MSARPDHAGADAGRITRGKTAPNRLRRFDAFLVQYDPALLRRRDGACADAPVVDLGYGAEPVTTLQMAACLRRTSPGLPVVGVEIDPERVARARLFADDLTDFRVGGFNLPVPCARLVRAFNVLRQYDEAEAEPALARLLAQTVPGGLVVDGTSCPWGRVWTASMLRRIDEGGELEALVFGTNFNGGFDPDAFTAAAAAMADRGWSVMRPRLWPRRGWLVLRRPGLELGR
jgi:hypothetical protein